MNEVAIVRFWNPTTGDKIHSVTIDPKDFIDDLCLAFSPDCKTLAITAGPIVALVDSATGKQVGQLGQINEKAGKAPFMETFSAVFSKDGSKVYTSGYPSTIMEWDFATRKLLRESDRDYGPGALALARDGKTLVVTGRGPIFYDLKEGQKIQAINTLTQPLQSLQYLSDGKTLLTSAAVGPGARGPSQQWDASSGKDLGTFKTSPVSSGYFAISPDGKIVAGLSKSAKAKKNKEPTNFVICDVVTGKELHQIPLQLGEFAIGMCFSPDSKSIVLAQPEKQKIELYDVATAKLIRPLASISSSPVTAKGKKSIQKQSMLFSPDGKLFAWSENRNPPSLSLIDVTTGKQIGTLALTAGPNLEGFGVTISPGLLASRLDRAAFSPDGRCLALDMEDGTAVLYELATGQPRIAFGKKLPLPKAPGKGEFEAAMVLLNSQTKARTCFAISPDGRRFAHAGADGVVHICDVLTGKELKEFKGHGEGVNALAFAPNGKTLASASADSTALIWDVSKIDRPATPPKSLKTAELEAWWQDMAGNDATKAFAAMSNLIAGPKDAAVWIKDRVKPAAPVDTKRAEELLAQLDSNQYKVRELANAELLRMGEQVVPLINKALAATPPLETKQRLELLRGKLTDTVLRGEQLRAHRAVEVLELIGTPEARQVLQELANGAPEARLTSSAQAALNR
ncbi:MAG TPA: WD40 repeat domain-containing protein, partial [Gemmataceae bacterium]|nr:WD40 repeat domain-containing protein [Gemmataceae bacterium]